jgi:hypothetical protein
VDTREVMLINISTLRSLWAVVERTQSSVLLGLSDTDLIKQVLGELHNQGVVCEEEVVTVRDYLSSKTSLIRDLAQSRQL